MHWDIEKVIDLGVFYSFWRNGMRRLLLESKVLVSFFISKRLEEIKALFIIDS